MVDVAAGEELGAGAARVPGGGAPARAADDVRQPDVARHDVDERAEKCEDYIKMHVKSLFC